MVNLIKFIIFFIFLLSGCERIYTPFENIQKNYIFVEVQIFTFGQIIERDTTKSISILAIEPGLFYSYNPNENILEYRTGAKVIFDEESQGIIVKHHSFYPPDIMGQQNDISVVDKNYSYTLLNNITFKSIDDDGNFNLIDNNKGNINLPIDSTASFTYTRLKKTPQFGGDPYVSPDSALLQITDIVDIYNHGYHKEKQFKWNHIWIPL